MDRQEALKAIGSEWQKGNYHRIYFNDLGSRLGIETNRYNTGNISSATQDGERISNSQAKRVLGRCVYSKFWYDVPTDTYYSKGELTADDCKRIKASIEAEVTALMGQGE